MNSPWQPRNGVTLILDNRDSFTYNLAHRLAELGEACAVVRSDEVSVAQIEALSPRALIVSPGPGHPNDAGVSVAAIQALHGQVPILGVCLGHQAIGVAFGGRVGRNGRPCHGMASAVNHSGTGLFVGIQSPAWFGRYHSLAIEAPLPPGLEEVAEYEGLNMAVAHRDAPTFGVQFHPESVLSPDGYQLLRNFLNLV